MHEHTHTQHGVFSLPSLGFYFSLSDISILSPRISVLNATAVKVVDGMHLKMQHVQRTDMGGYLCIASNGVPPSVSKRFDVQVMCKYNSSMSCICLVYV